MTTIDILAVPKVRLAPGAAGEIGRWCKDRAIGRVLIVTDAGVARAGLPAGLYQGLDDAQIGHTTYADVTADPPVAQMQAALTQGREAGVEAVIGFGGGSPMDVAKVVALLLRAPQQLEDAYGVGNALGERLPLVLVPTTAGTGSETTPIAILTKPDHQKAGVVAPQLMPDMAVLDPALTVGLPPHVTASCGVDAMVHAIEAFTSKIKKNPFSDALARQALALMGRSIVTAVHQGADVDARGDMLLGAHLAGLAFANAPCAAVHALAYPLGGRFGVSHGLSNSLVLSEVMRFNLPVAKEAYAALAPLVFPDLNDGAAGAGQLAGRFIDRLGALTAHLGLETRLSQVGVAASDLDMLAADAMQQTRLLVNNPREVTEADAREIYAAVL